MSRPTCSPAPAERDELRETAQRIQADFENYRKRVSRDQTSLVERATDGLVEAILPALDGLEMAVVSLGDAANDKVRKGVELAFGSSRPCSSVRVSSASPSLGVPFDPNQHEAVLQDDGDGEPHRRRRVAHRLHAQRSRRATGDGEGRAPVRRRRRQPESTGQSKQRRTE